VRNTSFSNASASMPCQVVCWIGSILTSCLADEAPYASTLAALRNIKLRPPLSFSVALLGSRAKSQIGVLNWSTLTKLRSAVV
jgi:hypothetical protein